MSTQPGELQLLVAAGDNAARLSDEAAFAAMCGVSPVDASSGRQQRHASIAAGTGTLTAALVRLRSEPRTRAYVERRTSQGLSKREILRCLMRYIAREIFKLLQGSNRADDAREVA
jgi:transposase